MAKKDFSKVNTNPLYSALEDATAEVIPGQMEVTNIDMETQEAQEVKRVYKKRVTYTEQEAREAQEKLQTAGRKGVKLPRINLAFTPSNYDYVRTMAQVRGETLTDFINHIIEQSRTDNAEVYQRAMEFRKSL